VKFKLELGERRRLVLSRDKKEQNKLEMDKFEIDSSSRTYSFLVAISPPFLFDNLSYPIKAPKEASTTTTTVDKVTATMIPVLSVQGSKTCCYSNATFKTKQKVLT
jgi:hypothetical protein